MKRTGPGSSSATGPLVVGRSTTDPATIPAAGAGWRLAETARKPSASGSVPGLPESAAPGSIVVGVKKSRAEAFSDGVFAVAATVLVFNLVDPKVPRGLGTALLEAWPSYAAYVISFSTIVVIWVNHHGII